MATSIINTEGVLGSPVLSSDLSNDIVAQNILSCLHRDCIRKVLAVEELTERFHLQEFYCEEHGTKLKAESEDADEVGEEYDNGDGVEMDDNVNGEESDLHLEEATSASIDTTTSISQPNTSGEDISRDMEKLEIGNQEHNTKKRGNGSDKPSALTDTKLTMLDERMDEFVRDVAKSDSADSSMDVEKAEEESSSTKLTCIDCEMAKVGHLRCPECDNFESEDDFYTCEACSKIKCNTCEEECFSGPTCGGYCTACNHYFCGEDSCPTVMYCQYCDEMGCEDCRAIIICGVCNEETGCTDCVMDLDHGYTCYDCENSFCRDCKDYTFCETCTESFCADCRSGFFCNGCESVTCTSCGDANDCTTCGQKSCEECHFHCEDCDGSYCRQCHPKRAYYCSSCETHRCRSCNEDTDACGDCNRRGCKECTFQCSECETVTCPGCTKIYACGDCNKKICADCQSVFKHCCCESKGKFVLH